MNKKIQELVELYMVGCLLELFCKAMVGTPHPHPPIKDVIEAPWFG